MAAQCIHAHLIHTHTHGQPLWTRCAGTFNIYTLPNSQLLILIHMLPLTFCFIFSFGLQWTSLFHVAFSIKIILSFKERNENHVHQASGARTSIIVAINSTLVLSILCMRRKNALTTAMLTSAEHFMLTDRFNFIGFQLLVQIFRLVRWFYFYTHRSIMLFIQTLIRTVNNG